MVLIPDLEAGCSLAATIDATALQRWKDENPGAVVVSYVNTTAEVKALSDYCCTSGNARKVIEAVPEDREILFLPDMFLGAYLEKLTGRRMKIWPGECHVHAGIRPEDVTKMMEARPGADLLIHPECGCASQCMYAAAHDAKLAETTHVLSTEGMVNHATASPKREFVVATETGIMHRLHKEAPDKRFYAMSERAVCRYMKQITLPKVRDSLRDLRHEVTVPDEVAARARLAIERMVEIV
jgi:quinolinate synthase